MKAIKNFAILAVLIVLAAVGFGMFSQDASGTTLEILKLGKGMVKVMAALFVPLGIYIVAKSVT